MDIRNAQFVKLKETNEIYRLYFSVTSKIIDCYVDKNKLMVSSQIIINELYPGNIVSISILSDLSRKLLAINNRDIEHEKFGFYRKRMDFYSARIRTIFETDSYYRFSIKGLPEWFPLNWFWLEKDSIILVRDMVVTFSCYPKFVNENTYARVIILKSEIQPLDCPQIRISEIKLSQVKKYSHDRRYLTTFVHENYIQTSYWMHGRLHPDSEKLIDQLTEGENISITFDYRNNHHAHVVKINDIPIKYHTWGQQLWNYVFSLDIKYHKE